jgi:hypothetical protein
MAAKCSTSVKFSFSSRNLSTMPSKTGHITPSLDQVKFRLHMTEETPKRNEIMTVYSLACSILTSEKIVFGEHQTI